MAQNGKKSIFKLPPVLTLLFMMMIFCAIISWIVPAGEFDTEKVGRMTKVVAGTYHAVPATPVGPWQLLKALPEGFYNAIKLMTTVLMISGCVAVLTKTGVFKATFDSLAKKKLNVYVLVAVMMIFMSIAGATAVIANSSVAFIPIGVILAAGLGYDKFTGFLIIFIGCYAGFNVGWANIATIGTAQPLAELPIYSGFGARFVIYVINMILCYWFTIRYMKTIKGDYTKSLNYDGTMLESQVLGIGALDANASTEETVKLTKGHIFSLIGLVIAFGMQLLGSIKLGWGYYEQSATFFALGVICGFANGMDLEELENTFLSGCKSSLGAAMVIGFANGISVVLKQGNILNTIVYWLSIPLSHMGAVLGASFMFIANTIVNFFIGSGSGQAATVMPLMVPVADLTGITRQVAVQAFQFGDGFSNCL
ncbi:MAG: YfcC family protein, partial [Pyramidobacter sp.]|nr:YfcC family protein [Pyramidobacter sp.]